MLFPHNVILPHMLFCAITHIVCDIYSRAFVAHIHTTTHTLINEHIYPLALTIYSGDWSGIRTHAPEEIGPRQFNREKYYYALYRVSKLRGQSLELDCELP